MNRFSNIFSPESYRRRSNGGKPNKSEVASVGENASSHHPLRLKELDVLRGISAVAVLLSHYTAMYDYHHGLVNSLGFEFQAGSYGVYLFFVISGFVILLTLRRGETGMDFIVSRFSRIFPAYWTAILITFFFLVWLRPTPPSIGQLLANFTMLQRFRSSLGSPAVSKV